jgi:O-antigen/teichoic acid export membrane protein
LSEAIRDEKARVGRGTASLFVANLASLTANTVYYIILTNAFHSTAEVGVVTSLNIMIWFFVFLCLFAQPIVLGSPIPAPLAALKFVPEFLAKRDIKAASKVFQASLLLATVVSLVSILILTSSLPQLTAFLGWPSVLPDYVRLSALDILIISIGQVALGSLVAMRGGTVGSLYFVVWSVGRFALASILLVSYGVVGLLVGWLMGDFALLVATLHWVLRNLGLVFGSSNFSTTEFLRYNLYTLLGAVVGFTISQADRLIILWERGLSAIAVYNVAMVGAGVVGYVPYALITVLLPVLTSLSVSREDGRMHKLMRSYSRYVSLVVMPIGFGLAAVMEVALRIFGAAYVSGALAGALVSIAASLSAIGTVYAGALLALGKLRWYTVANLLGFAAMMIVAAIFTPLLGLMGPALGRASLMVVAATVYALAAFRCGIFEVDSRAYAVSALGSGVMMVSVFTILGSIHTFFVQLLAFPGVMVVGFIIYLGSLRLSHLLTTDDLDFFRELLPKRLGVLLPLAASFIGVDYDKLQGGKT